GLLGSLKEFPLDVLFEIFGHLNPMDLLNLARPTKEIRGILMVRSAGKFFPSSCIIIKSLVDSRPSSLPFDMNEPQYANLAFGVHCHVGPLSIFPGYL
ncbi:hypothetical protein B0H17DRAFT_937418, partial [Mycena rosella]